MNIYPKSQEEVYRIITERVFARKDEQGTISREIGLRFESVDYETRSAVFTHTAKASELNVRGTMHGGVTSWLLDTAMGSLAAAFTDTINPTLSMNVNYIAAILTGDELIIRAKLDHVGSSTIVTSAEIFIVKEGGEKLAASAVGTYFRLNND